jgi:hypothetical protein
MRGEKMSIPQWMKSCIATVVALFAMLAVALPSAKAGFHLWQIKEAYSNADGSVQFIEMFDSFSTENSVFGFKLSSNSDGVVKEFVFPASLIGETLDHHLLIATPGFGSLPGAVTPDFTFDQGGVSGPFFNPNAANIQFSFEGSGDTMAFTGASLPKNGINSLTDAGAVGFPPGTPNISSGVNSPTNFGGASGSITPEPTTGVLLALGVIGLRCVRRRH